MAISHGDHHFHRRRKAGEVPHNHDKLKHFMDKWIYFVAVLGPLMTLPQVIKVWVNNQVEGVSLLSWSGFTFISLSWLLYGILHKDKAIIFANILFAWFQLLVAIGVIIHG